MRRLLATLLVASFALPMPAILLSAGLGLSPASARVSLPESQVIDQLGDCVVRAEPLLTRTLLETEPDSGQESERLKILAKRASNCMRMSRLAMPGWVLRGTVAGARLRADADDLQRARALPLLVAERVAPAKSNGALMRTFAACVAGADPAGAAELVAQPLCGAASKAAVAALAPTLSACIPENLDLKIRIPELRVDIADALYRRVHDMPALVAQLDSGKG